LISQTNNGPCDKCIELFKVAGIIVHTNDDNMILEMKAMTKFTLGEIRNLLAHSYKPKQRIVKIDQD
jgi:hypothetical protein